MSPGCYSEGSALPAPLYRSKAAIARVCHEANRALQVVLEEENVSPHWEDAPGWQRDSATEGVDKAIAGATPEQLHESWCEFKRADGCTAR